MLLSVLPPVRAGADQAAGADAAGASPAATELLAALTAGLASGADLAGLLLRFLEPLVRIAGAGGGALRVLDEQGSGMHLLGSVGLPAAVLAAERQVDPGCGVCGAALASHEAQRSDDLTPCVRRSAGQYFGQECRRVMAVPLQYRGRRLGLISLFFADGREPAGEVLALTKTVGELMGLALHNAELERANLRAGVLHERQNLAAELHDSIGQSLTFVKMRLPLLQDAIAAGDTGVAERLFDDVRQAVGQAHGSLRGLLTQFRTPPDPQGLGHALAEAAERFRRTSGVALDLHDTLPPQLLAAEQETQVALIAQEALANVARHAVATRARMALALTAAGEVQLCVEDDGQGLPAMATAAGGRGGDAGASHYGLAIMRERAARLGGTLDVGPRGGGGTRVQLTFPAPRATSLPQEG